MNLRVTSWSLILISGITIIYWPTFFYIQAQSDVNPQCVIRGESVPPPPFVILRWNASGICDSTIDHFVHFYDIRSIINNNDTDFIVFLESN